MATLNRIGGRGVAKEADIETQCQDGDKVVQRCGQMKKDFGPVMSCQLIFVSFE